MAVEEAATGESARDVAVARTTPGRTAAVEAGPEEPRRAVRPDTDGGDTAGGTGTGRAGPAGDAERPVAEAPAPTAERAVPAPATEAPSVAEAPADGARPDSRQQPRLRTSAARQPATGEAVVADADEAPEAPAATAAAPPAAPTGQDSGASEPARAVAPPTGDTPAETAAAPSGPVTAAAPTTTPSPPAAEPASATPAEQDASPPPPKPYLQAGVFTQEGLADRLVAGLAERGVPARALPITFRGRAAQRVRAGPFETRDEMRAAIRALRAFGVADAAPVER
ncbi:MAG: SPOR domain-containing protein [Pseudomonadota bacterium]